MITNELIKMKYISAEISMKNSARLSKKKAIDEKKIEKLSPQLFFFKMPKIFSLNFQRKKKTNRKFFIHF